MYRLDHSLFGARKCNNHKIQKNFHKEKEKYASGGLKSY